MKRLGIAVAGILVPALVVAGGLSLKDRIGLRSGFDAADKAVVARTQRLMKSQRHKGGAYDADNWVDVGALVPGDWVFLNLSDAYVQRPATGVPTEQTLGLIDTHGPSVWMAGDALSFRFVDYAAHVEGRKPFWRELPKAGDAAVWGGPTYRRVPPGPASPSGLLVYRTATKAKRAEEERQATARNQARAEARQQELRAKLAPYIDTWIQTVILVPPGQFVGLGQVRVGDVVLYRGVPMEVRALPPIPRKSWWHFPEGTRGWREILVHCPAAAGCGTVDAGLDTAQQTTRLRYDPAFGDFVPEIYRLDPGSPAEAQARVQARVYKEHARQVEAAYAARKAAEAEALRQQELAEAQAAEAARKRGQNTGWGGFFGRGSAYTGGGGGGYDSGSRHSSSSSNDGWWSSYRRYEAARQEGRLERGSSFNPNEYY